MRDGELTLLKNWSIVLENGEYCRPEEQELCNIHIRGYQEILYDGSVDCLKNKIIRLLTITSPIFNVVDDSGIFETKSGHKYFLFGDSDVSYRSVIGCLNPVERLVEIIKKKKMLV